MDRSRFFHRVSITVLSLCALASSAWSAAALQLTNGVNAGEFSITPDGSRIVFQSYNGTDNVLYSARTDGVGSPILISPSTGPSFLFNGKFTPDSSRFVFNTYENPADGFHVVTYSNRLDGNGTPVLLNNSKLFDDDPSQYNLATSPDSQSVVIRADQGDYNFDLLSRRIDGSGTVVSLSDGPPHGEGFGNGVAFNWVAAGNRVVYSVPPGGVSSPQLFSSLMDGSAPAIQLSPQAEVFGESAVSRDGLMAVFTTDVGTVPKLYSRSVAGGPLTLLASQDNKDLSFQQPQLDSHGQHAVYFSGDRLLTVPTDGSALPKPLGPYPDGTDAWTAIDPAGTQVAFRSRQEIYVQAIDASSNARKLSAAQNCNLNLFQFTPDGSHLVYYCSPVAGMIDGVFSVPVDGSHEPVLLTASGNIRITPDGRNLIYATGSVAGIAALYEIGIDGGQPLLLAENPYGTGSILPWGEGWQITADGSKLIFTADDGAARIGIFAVAIPEPNCLAVLVGAALTLILRRRGRLNLQ